MAIFIYFSSSIYAILTFMFLSEIIIYSHACMSWPTLYGNLSFFVGGITPEMSYKEHPPLCGLTKSHKRLITSILTPVTDQRLWFRFLDSTIPLLPIFKIARLLCFSSSVCTRYIRKTHGWFSHDAAHLIIVSFKVIVTLMPEIQITRRLL